MSRRPGPPATSALPPQNRQNEYFVPRDGIDREVITADICRYLGNDALVRPGTYENPQNGQIIQGYYINAYRNLTTAMIEDLKADSARWEQERRQQSASRSNTAGVQYRNSDTHQSRQYYGPTEGAIPSDVNRDPYGDAGPRYPGTGAAGYTGASGSSFASQQYPQGGYSTQPGYAVPSSQFQSPSGGVSYSAGHPSMSGGGFGQGSQDPPYQVVGADLTVSGSNPQPMYDSYARDPRGDLRDQRVPVSTMASSRTTYTTSGPPPPQGYPSSGSGNSYYPQTSSPANPAAYVSAAHPRDPFFGRASGSSYPSAPDPQYDNTPVPSRASAAPTNAQMPTSGTSSRNRDRDSVDRHSDSRHAHRHSARR